MLLKNPCEVVILPVPTLRPICLCFVRQRPLHGHDSGSLPQDWNLVSQYLDHVLVRPVLESVGDVDPVHGLLTRLLRCEEIIGFEAHPAPHVRRALVVSSFCRRREVLHNKFDVFRCTRNFETEMSDAPTQIDEFGARNIQRGPIEA